MKRLAIWIKYHPQLYTSGLWYLVMPSWLWFWSVGYLDTGAGGSPLH